MSFVDKLQRAREVLEQQGRLSLRALRRELDIEDEELDELIEELVDVQRVTVREGNALAWAPRSQGASSSLTTNTPTANSLFDERAALIAYHWESAGESDLTEAHAHWNSLRMELE
jgi:hypothetical protein